MKSTKTLNRAAGPRVRAAALMIGATRRLRPQDRGRPQEETAPPKPGPLRAEGQAKVQLAILLDTSGSMSGLIEQTKTQLWSIVNTFIDAKQNGKVPFVEVALYEYGNDGLKCRESLDPPNPASHPRPRPDQPGSLRAAHQRGIGILWGGDPTRDRRSLDWDQQSEYVYKAIFVAGNEPFTQGPDQSKQKACKDAIAKGVIVNTIHCGDEQHRDQRRLEIRGGPGGRQISHHRPQQGGGAYRRAAGRQDHRAQHQAQLDLHPDRGKAVARCGAEAQVAQDNLAANARRETPSSQRALPPRASGELLERRTGTSCDACVCERTSTGTKLKEEDLPEEMKQDDARRAQGLRRRRSRRSGPKIQDQRSPRPQQGTRQAFVSREAQGDSARTPKTPSTRWWSARCAIRPCARRATGSRRSK